MTELFQINVRLSENQKKNLSTAYHKRETIVLRLTNNSLHGNDILYVPAMIKKRLEKNRKLNKGMDIRLAKTNIRKQVGGNLLTSILSLGRTLLPTVGKTLGLSALSGLASEGASQLVKAISGKGVQTGGFLVPQDKIKKLIEYKHLLSTKQKQDILNALQSGSGVHIRPTKSQSGGFLGTLLASIGIPMAIDAVKKLMGGSAPQIGLRQELGYQKCPLHFIVIHHMSQVMVKKKEQSKNKNQERDYYWEKTVHSMAYPFWGRYCKTKILSNHDLIKWCKYLNIPINDVLSRDKSIPHNHKQALFIYNLEPSYMSGSHWVATYVKDNIINYFDSFGMPPFQEIVNHAKKKNLTILHQNNQIQNLKTTTCGYFCLYFLNEMNKGNSYYDLLQVFNTNDTMKNETFIEHYFKNI